MHGLMRVGHVAAAGRRSSAMAGTLVVFLLSGLGALYCQSKVWGLHGEERYLAQHGREAGALYAQTMERSAAERQLAAFDERLLLVEEVFAWKRLQLFLMVVGLLTGLAAYVLHALQRSRVEGARPVFGLTIPATR